jgi:hypothetical protein
MSECDAADGGRDFRTVTRPVCDGVVTMTATVDVEDLSPPRVLHVLDRGAQLEREYAALVDGVDGAEVLERRDEASDRLSQLECDSAAATVLVDVENVSREVSEWLAATAADFEDAFLRVAGEAREEAITMQ